MSIRKIKKSEYYLLASLKRKYTRYSEKARISSEEAPLNAWGEPGESKEWSYYHRTYNAAHRQWLDALVTVQERVGVTFGLCIDMLLDYKTALPASTMQAQVHNSIKIKREEAREASFPTNWGFGLPTPEDVTSTPCPAKDAELDRATRDRSWYRYSVSQLIDQYAAGDLKFSAQVIDVLRCGGCTQTNKPLRYLP